MDDGFEKTEYALNSPFQCLFVDKMLWKSMKCFSADNILLIISDCIYSRDEYIHNYSDFISLISD